MQAEACHDLAGLNEVRVGIDEGGCEQPTAKINFGLVSRVASSRLIAADIADQIYVDHDSRRAWMIRSVDTSPDKDHEPVRSE
jgi:hypothetical protein